MRRIAVINQKGGVGKTTTTANLGVALGAAGRRVLLIDLDPQAHLTMHYGVDPDSLTADQPSVYDLLSGAQPIGQITLSVRPNITLLPATIDLAGIETELASVVGREVILREALDELSDAYDIMLIDCPPSLGLLTINALAATDEVIIPMQAHFLALQGLSRLLKTVTLVRQRINPTLQIRGIVLCMFDTGTRLAGEVVEDLKGFLESSRGTDAAWSGAHLYQTRIRRNIKLAESPSYGQTVFDYAPTCHGAIDYADLASEVLADEESTEHPADAKPRVIAEATAPQSSAVDVAPLATVPAVLEETPPSVCPAEPASREKTPPGSAPCVANAS